MKYEETLKSLRLTTGDFEITLPPKTGYPKFFERYLKKAKIPKRYQGISHYRYDENPKEKLWAMFFFHKNTNPAEGRHQDDVFAQLLVSGSVDRWDVPRKDVSDRDMRILATAFQWLGSPVGSQQLIELLCSFPTDDKEYIIRRLQQSMRRIIWQPGTWKQWRKSLAKLRLL